MENKVNLKQIFKRFAAIRILLGIVICLAAVIPLQLIFKTAGDYAFGPHAHAAWWQILNTVFSILAIIAAYRFFVRKLEARACAELDYRSFFASFSAGTIFGAGLFCSVILVLWIIGSIHFSGFNNYRVMLNPFFAALSAGVLEEVLFRGIFFRIIEEKGGSVIALCSSALFFGFAHSFEPGATIFSSLSIAITAGVLLSSVFILKRNLWLPIGLHFAWNFMESGIFGLANSGKTSTGLLQSSLSGPEYVTGGLFGPEASVITIIIILLVSTAILWKSVQAKLIVTLAENRNKG